jgi:hypothetical protein
MANAIYDPRIEPHAYVIVLDDERRARLGVMEAIEGMTSTLGNRIISICANGIKMRKHGTGDEYFVNEAEISLTEARRFGWEKTPAQIADDLIEGINGCPHLNALDRFERTWRDMWRRLNQFPTEVQPPGYSVSAFTYYFHVMAAYANRKRQLERGTA